MKIYGTLADSSDETLVLALGEGRRLRTEGEVATSTSRKELETRKSQPMWHGRVRDCPNFSMVHFYHERLFMYLRGLYLDAQRCVMIGHVMLHLTQIVLDTDEVTERFGGL